MATKVEVLDRGGSDVHVVERKPDELSRLVNDAIKANDRFVTFDVPGKKKLSVIAESVNAIWEEQPTGRLPIQALRKRSAPSG